MEIHAIKALHLFLDHVRHWNRENLGKAFAPVVLGALSASSSS